MRRAAAGSCFALCVLLGACASVPKPTLAVGQPVLSGRMTVRVDPPRPGLAGHTETAAFELAGDPQSGSLALASPLGTRLALAEWKPGQVTLSTPQGRSDYADIGTLTRSVLGQRLPVDAMFYWLRGKPWPGAPSVARMPDPSDDRAGRPLPGFTQGDWDVDLSGFADGMVVARQQEPPVTVRVQLDRP